MSPPCFMHPCTPMSSCQALQGAWLWGWKDRIDRQWMNKYGKDLGFGMPGSMTRSGSKNSSVSMDAQAMAAVSAAKMRCGGCGSKACPCRTPSRPCHRDTSALLRLEEPGLPS